MSEFINHRPKSIPEVLENLPSIAHSVLCPHPSLVMDNPKLMRYVLDPLPLPLLKLRKNVFSINFTSKVILRSKEHLAIMK
jgi:hypothetical protein